MNRRSTAATFGAGDSRVEESGGSEGRADMSRPPEAAVTPSCSKPTALSVPTTRSRGSSSTSVGLSEIGGGCQGVSQSQSQHDSATTSALAEEQSAAQAPVTIDSETPEGRARGSATNATVACGHREAKRSRSRNEEDGATEMPAAAAATLPEAHCSAAGSDDSQLSEAALGGSRSCLQESGGRGSAANAEQSSSVKPSEHVASIIGQPLPKDCNVQLFKPFDYNWRRLVVRRNLPSEVDGTGAKIPKTTADAYYYAPCGKKLRSTPQIQGYLVKHPNANLGIECFTFLRRPVACGIEPYETIRQAGLASRYQPPPNIEGSAAATAKAAAVKAAVKVATKEADEPSHHRHGRATSLPTKRQHEASPAPVATEPKRPLRQLAPKTVRADGEMLQPTLSSLRVLQECASQLQEAFQEQMCPVGPARTTRRLHMTAEESPQSPSAAANAERPGSPQGPGMQCSHCCQELVGDDQQQSAEAGQLVEGTQQYLECQACACESGAVGESMDYVSSSAEQACSPEADTESCVSEPVFVNDEMDMETSDITDVTFNLEDFPYCPPHVQICDEAKQLMKKHKDAVQSIGRLITTRYCAPPSLKKPKGHVTLILNGRQQIIQPEDVFVRRGRIAVYVPYDEEDNYASKDILIEKDNGMHTPEQQAVKPCAAKMSEPTSCGTDDQSVTKHESMVSDKGLLPQTHLVKDARCNADTLVTVLGEFCRPSTETIVSASLPNERLPHFNCEIQINCELSPNEPIKQQFKSGEHVSSDDSRLLDETGRLILDDQQAMQSLSVSPADNELTLREKPVEQTIAVTPLREVEKPAPAGSKEPTEQATHVVSQPVEVGTTLPTNRDELAVSSSIVGQQHVVEAIPAAENIDEIARPFEGPTKMEAISLALGDELVDQVVLASKQHSIMDVALLVKANEPLELTAFAVQQLIEAEAGSSAVRGEPMECVQQPAELEVTSPSKRPDPVDQAEFAVEEPVNWGTLLLDKQSEQVANAAKESIDTKAVSPVRSDTTVDQAVPSLQQPPEAEAVTSVMCDESVSSPPVPAAVQKPGCPSDDGPVQPI